MKRATLTETKNRLSALIDEVKAGETILVLERLERQGLVTRPKCAAPRSLLESRPPKPRRGAKASQRLIEERASGR